MPRWARRPTPKCLQPCYLSNYLRFSLHQGPSLIADGEHEDSDYDHGEGQELPHGEGSEDKSKVGMQVSSSVLAALLPPDFGEWEPVAGGESGASVVHDHGRKRYAKLVSPERVAELAAERDRSVWVNQTDIPGARVLDWRECDAGAVLVTQAVPGVPASTLDAVALGRAWHSVVASVRAMHGLATEQCPFDRTLAQMMILARASVAEDRVVVDFPPQSTAAHSADADPGTDRG